MSEELTVEQHYGTDSITQRVQAALDRAGFAGKPIEWSELALLDQFHTRGLPASRDLAALLEIVPGSTVLDVGCGIGGSSRFLAATFGCDVTGIDLTSSFVDTAIMLSERTGLSAKTHFKQGDALAMPFDSESFDYAWTQHVAMNIEDRPALYREIYRVLKPGGRLAIHDIMAGNGEPLTFPVPWARIPELNFLITPDSMNDLLVSTGFRALKWIDMTEPTLAWLNEPRQPIEGPPAAGSLGLHMVMGPDFLEMFKNLELNIREDRLKLVQAVVEK